MTVLICDLGSAWPTGAPVPVLSSLDILLWDAYIVFREGVGNFEVGMCWFLVGDAVNP